MVKKKDVTLDEVLKAVNDGFNQMEHRFRELEIGQVKTSTGLLFFQKETRDDLKWIKEILEKHTGTLKRLDEERLFTISYVQRLEKEIIFIKKHLKIA